MELLICGTAAAEGWPALFCPCELCAEARRRGGRNLRSRSAYMLGDRLRIDFGPDSFYHQQRYGLDYSRLEALLLTHAHADHWLARELHYRQPGFAQLPEDAVLPIYGSERAAEFLRLEAGDDPVRYRYVVHRVAAFAPFTVSREATAIPLLAAHDPSQECFNYLIEVEGKRLLIAHDTGWYGEETWKFLAGNPLDVVIMDCTGGPVETRKGHMSCSVVCEFRDRLAALGSLAPGARAIATHFSHNGGWLHEQLEAFLGPRNVETAYDGMKVAL